MAERLRSPSAAPTFAWVLVLCLVGLDYFSTLAYLPSIAVDAAGALAPLAAVGVVAVTLLLAVPIYAYVVGRSPDGHGATGLLDQRTRGWGGKLLILIVLGFVATDFVITRTLSVADASVHLLANPLWRVNVEWMSANEDAIRATLPAALRGGFFDFWTEQLVLTVALSLACFGLWWFLQRGFTRIFLRLAVLVVGLYLLLNLIIVGSCLTYLADNPAIVRAWWQNLSADPRLPLTQAQGSFTAALALLALVSFPQMALGLSGFELSMASAPLVRGDEREDPARPRGRIRRTRLLMLAAALIMGIFVLGSVFSVTLLVPHEQMVDQRPIAGALQLRDDSRLHAQHRALAYVAHGEDLQEGIPASAVSPLFGLAFGTIYDISTLAILCLAGASSAIGMKDLVPHYLARFGMQLHWAQRTGVILHLFNLIVLLVLVGFRASVSAQQWAYATSVLVLLTSAAIAALLDVRTRWKGSWLRLPVVLPFYLVAVFFLFMAALTAGINRSGLWIALALVGVTIATAFVSRWMRSTELRFEGFTFADERSKARWDEMCKLEFQLLVPHRPGTISLEEKEKEIRMRHRLGAEIPIILVEVTRGDPSDFMQAPFLTMSEADGREVVHVSRCASVAHVLAAMGLAFCEVGQPPEIHFGWSDESPLAANLNFLLLGEGNVPWMVHSLLRKAQPDPARRPRVVIG